MLHDTRLAVRLLWKDWRFSATVLLTLSVCIAGNVAIFSVVNTVLLQPLRVPDPEQVMLLYNAYPGATGAVGDVRGATSVPHYFDRLEKLDAFDEQSLYRGVEFTVGSAGRAEQVFGWQVTPSFFRLAGVPPHLGRMFTEAEGKPGSAAKVIVSYGLWQRLLAGDPAALGRDLRLDSHPYELVGVMPPEFRFEDDTVQLWVPLPLENRPASAEERHTNAWQMLGRLKPGVSVAQAQTQVDQLAAAELELFPQYRQMLTDTGFHTVVTPLQEEMVRDIRGALYLLWGGVLFVLLIGGINVANLMLIRATARIKEWAMRHALGASRARLARQVFTECLVLTLTASLVGVGLGQLGVRWLTTLGAETLPGGDDIIIGPVVLAWTIGLAVLLGVGLGLVPVVTLSRSALERAVRQEGRGATTGRGVRVFRHVLVSTQIAVAFVLLMGAILLLVSFQRILAVNPGFRPEHLLTAQISLPEARYDTPAARRVFAERALERLRQLPGVVGATLTSAIPFGNNQSNNVIRAVGYEHRPGESLVAPIVVTVDGDYFETLGIPILEGRTFDERDTADAMPAIVIDERLARRFWPGRSAIGGQLYQHVELTEETPIYTVIGVVAEHALRGLVDVPEQNGAYFFTHTQRPLARPTFAVRTAGDPEHAMNSVRAALATVDPEQPVYAVQTMEQRMMRRLTSRRTPMVLAVGFAGVALFLSALGIYGVVAYRVAQRRREFGIRLALGSSATHVLRLVLSEGAVLLAIGVAGGVIGGQLLGAVVASQLYGIRATEPWVALTVVGLLGLVTLLACAIPARRAARLDPATILGDE